MMARAEENIRHFAVQYTKKKGIQRGRIEPIPSRSYSGQIGPREFGEVRVIWKLDWRAKYPENDAADHPRFSLPRWVATSTPMLLVGETMGRKGEGGGE